MLLRECYAAELEEEPELTANLVLKLAIASEPEVGGMLETAEFTSDDELSQRPSFAECIRETTL